MTTVPRVISNKTALVSGMAQRLKSFSLFEPVPMAMNTVEAAPSVQTKINNTSVTGIGLEIPSSYPQSAMSKAFFVDCKHVR
eukprot:CAMPEP_0178925154 /NCGR_PEP_ID=MMETSP0786-20121207/17744_1 /TAXON_ID=186022 /ORGANISM="Thalassionema frauenfeldii, Strain CCMP 1798" /LENGTH=81 /DNA_ID=CAMNT_0020599983 /DNA_START=44 /DNA_END=289 /DNA_ORIENTATION=-